jgi:hypothetical protein
VLAPGQSTGTKYHGCSHKFEGPGACHCYTVCPKREGRVVAMEWGMGVLYLNRGALDRGRGILGREREEVTTVVRVVSLCSLTKSLQRTQKSLHVKAYRHVRQRYGSRV